MLFSSLTFIFIFLPIVILFCILCKFKYHNIILLFFSIIFYAWHNPKYLFILFSVILISYIGAIFIYQYQKLKKIFLFFTVTVIAAFLIYFKYFNFLLSIFNRCFDLHITFIEIILPIGISFYVFQALSYVIDVYRGDCKVQRNFLNYSLYISFFPQLVAGPIIKYHEVERQLIDRKISFNESILGVKRFIIGLSKKVLIADMLGHIVDKIFIQNPDCYTPIIAWLGAFAYTLQIYFDFSGYSDMAIGLGAIFGFKFIENFNYPYISKSINEHFRRWHISLMTWLKLYIYIPLGGNRKGKFRTCQNIFWVFFFAGLWHGASFTSIMWGVWSAFWVILERVFSLKTIQENYNNIFYNFIYRIYYILVILIGSVIFRSDTISYAFKYVLNMYGLLSINKENILYRFDYYVNTVDVIVIIIAILCCTPIFKNLIYKQNFYEKIFINILLLILFVLSLSNLVANTYNPFIYFKF